jgi:hypothetical protein
MGSKFRKRVTCLVAVKPLSSAHLIPEFAIGSDPQPVIRLQVFPGINSMEWNT